MAVQKVFKNPRRRMAAILKTIKRNNKRQYICNRLTDFDEIWYGDAHWPSQPDWLLKILNFENPRWPTAAILTHLFVPLRLPENDAPKLSVTSASVGKLHCYTVNIGRFPIPMFTSA